MKNTPFSKASFTAKMFSVLLCLSYTVSKAQTTFTATNVRVTDTLTNLVVIKAEAITANDTIRSREHIVAEQNIEVQGSLSVTNDIRVGTSMAIGSATNFIKLGFTSSTTAMPAMFKLAGPSLGTDPSDSPDPTPDLSCITGLTYLNAFQNALSVSKNSIMSPGTGGNIVMGHTGTRAFFETQGTGTGGASHPGDLYINSNCKRNVLFFEHTTGFAPNVTGVISVNGKIGVSGNMQIGALGTAFIDNNSQLYINAIGASQKNGLKIRHAMSTAGSNGIKIIEQVDTDKALAVFKSVSATSDGVERFSVQGDGKTMITTENADALNVLNAASPTLVNFRVKATGATEINNAVYNSKSLVVKGPFENFLVYGNGQTHIATNMQIGFGGNSAIQDNTARQHILINSGESGVNKGLKFTTNDNSVKLISVSNSLFTTSSSPFTVKGDGKTQIGGEFATNSTYWLTVNGKIGARAIKVSIQTIWPDYVFEKKYKLQNLTAVEDYVIKNKHLPNIPSAAELNSEVCGLDLAEMQGKQMEKIEEIYLYLFELKKEVEKLKKENVALKNKINK